MSSLVRGVLAKGRCLWVLTLLSVGLGGTGCLGGYHDDGDIPENELFGFEARWAEISEGLPEFAGYYYQGGDVVVRVTSMTVADRACNIAREELGLGDSTAVRVVWARYSFLQLNEWRSRIRRSALEIDGAVGLDLDEVQNRIVVAVEIGHPSARSDEEHLFDAAHIPCAATRIVEVEPPQPL